MAESALISGLKSSKEILNQGQFTFKKKNPSQVAIFELAVCKGRREKEGKQEAGAEAAELRKRLLRAEVRQHKPGGDRAGFAHLGTAGSSSTAFMLLSTGTFVLCCLISSLKVLVGKVSSFISDSDRGCLFSAGLSG